MKRVTYFVGFGQYLDGRYGIEGFHIISNYTISAEGKEVGPRTFHDIKEARHYAKYLKTLIKNPDAPLKASIQKIIYEEPKIFK